MPDLSFYERQHLQKLLQQEGSIKYIFDEFVRNTGVYMARWTDTGNNNVWVRNASIEKGIEKELTDLQSKLLKNIESYDIDSWNRSNKKTDDLVSSFVKGFPINDVARNGLFIHNKEVLTTFLKQKINGLDLSGRVWNISGTAKENIEYYLSSGLATGRSAALISQDVRQLLKKPDRRFRRIRNKNGKLVASAPMKAYQPGTGVYRSSYKNALRLAVTNTNEMYRLTDCERWQGLDFVLGIEIRRSASAHEPCSICDPLTGRYPKDYKFLGFHPFCICIATPILMKEEDFLDALVTGNWPVDEYIQDIPFGPMSYMKDQLRKANITTDSYLFRNNKGFFDGTRGNVVQIARELGSIQNIRSESGKAMVAFIPFSDLIIKSLSSIKINAEKQKLFKEVLNDDSFKVLSSGDRNVGETLLHPLHRGVKSKSWAKTKQMARDINKTGVDVAFLPEYDDISSADAITVINKKFKIVDFKYSSTTNWNTLAVELEKGFKQANSIVLKVDKMDSGQFREAIEYIKRNWIKYGDIKLINKYGKIIDLERDDLRKGLYRKKIKGFL